MFRSPRVWRWGALGLCIVVSAIVIWAPGPDRTLRSALAIHDFGHVVGFGLVTSLLSFSWSAGTHAKARKRIGATCLAATAAVAIGAAVELAQAAKGGSADPWDIVRDGGGAVAVALLLIALDRGLPRRVSVLIGAVAVGTFLGFASPIVVALHDEARARAQFPLLVGFEREGELARLRFQHGATRNIVRLTDEGRAVSGVKLLLPPGPYPGVGLIYFPRDWSGMRALRLLIVNPEPTPAEITVRIDDAEHQHNLAFHDRFNRAFALQPGPNRIEVPLEDVRTAPRDRELDLERVESLLIFAVDLAQPREIVIGPIALVR
jgi:hypothetical protein